MLGGAGFTALVALALIVPAMSSSAIIGASQSPITTQAPDLRSPINIVNATLKQAQFCFDQAPTVPAGTEANFHLTGYDDAITTFGTTFTAVSGNCITVQFAGTREITYYTVGTVDWCTVFDQTNTYCNDPDAALISGAALGAGGPDGKTSGPDYVSSAVVSSSNTDINYTFDSKLDPAICNAGLFGYYTSSGTRDTGASCSISGSSPNVARVTFATFLGTPARMYVEGSAVFDQVDAFGTQDPNPFGSNTTGTAYSDLTSATRLDDTHVQYVFDKPTGGGNATTCDGTDYFVFEEDATQYTGLGCVASSTASTNIATVTFPGTINFSTHETPTAGVQDDGDELDQPATAGAAKLATSQESVGFMDSPDLESADFNASSEQVTYNWDERVDSSSAPLGPNSSYCITDSTGGAAEDCGGNVVSVFNDAAGKGHTVVDFTGSSGAPGPAPVPFPNAIAAIVYPGAITDYPGNTNVEAAAGRPGTFTPPPTTSSPGPTTSATATATPTATPTKTPTPTPTPTVTPTKTPTPAPTPTTTPTPNPPKKSDTTLKLNKPKVRPLSVRFFGRLKAVNPNVCDTGHRSVALLRGNKQVASKFTTDLGKYSFKRPLGAVHAWHVVFRGKDGCRASSSAVWSAPAV
ncbi:MAG: hypothetical protein ABR600_10125 [Actinomycetota bacterium]